MATGLKNAMDTISEIKPHVHFAVNEECAVRSECRQYSGFSKPVFHIEYPPLQLYLSVSATERQRYCVDNQAGLKSYFHTVMKAKKLDGGVEYCDGVYAKTPTREVREGASLGRDRGSKGSRPAKYAVDGYANEGTMDSSKAWQFDDNMITHQANLAMDDGYPFAPGEGSERYISDADLGAYELETPVLPEPNPQVSGAQPGRLVTVPSS
jgi:Glycoside-hydrolase family GH114